MNLTLSLLLLLRSVTFGCPSQALPRACFALKVKPFVDTVSLEQSFCTNCEHCFMTHGSGPGQQEVREGTEMWQVQEAWRLSSDISTCRDKLDSSKSCMKIDFESSIIDVCRQVCLHCHPFLASEISLWIDRPVHHIHIWPSDSRLACLYRGTLIHHYLTLSSHLDLSSPTIIVHLLFDRSTAP